MFHRKMIPLLAAMMTALMLVISGCGSTANNAASANKDTAAQAEASGANSTASSKVELLVSAAASLTESMDELKTIYEAAHNDVNLTFNYGASGTLQQQIEQGAPADLFLSAGKKQMDALLDKGLIDAKLSANLLTNDLVLIVPENATVQINALEDLGQAGNIAIGTPESVPAGKYAQQTLTYYKLWDSLQPKLVMTKDVKQVLSYVETGNADAGFVYKTDAAVSAKVKIALTADPASHDPIEYPAGVLTGSQHPDEAKAFYEFLQSAEAMEVFKKYGFNPAE
ncbi:molybdate ABC transporter substrate-binding protein [Paenibacillus macerans]|uniref:molybdate ABC transporter substrate-binding protein n=1 Tax=Paenibacillus macerans TaxID=44252 RepID=UPI002E1F57A1|nr:molybdate ABC transporter substrate-binding protein [Paenibacillus macerans]MED4959273.1 molybdate ABC transporter substrate-binding protein [Paenibacillus macerans]